MKTNRWTTRSCRFMISTVLLFTVTLASAGSSCRTESDDCIRLQYPSSVSSEQGEAFKSMLLRNLGYLQEFLGITADRTIHISVHPTLLGWSGRFSGRFDPLVEYSVPELSLIDGSWIQLSDGHELAHALMSMGWAGFAVPALEEGMATAAHFIISPSALDPHLVARGLAVSDNLMTLEELFSIAFRDSLTFLESELQIYQESASFMLFLVERFGIGLVKRTYQHAGFSCARIRELLLAETGETLEQLESSWHAFLTNYTEGRDSQAEALVRSLRALNDRIMPSVNRLEILWRSEGASRVSFSRRAYEDHADLRALISELGDIGTSVDSIPSLHSRIKQMIQEFEFILSNWILAASSCEQLISDGLLPETRTLLSSLRCARQTYELYAAVGDTRMATSVRKLASSLESSAAQLEPRVTNRKLTLLTSY